MMTNEQRAADREKAIRTKIKALDASLDAWFHEHVDPALLDEAMTKYRKDEHGGEWREIKHFSDRVDERHIRNDFAEITIRCDRSHGHFSTGHAVELNAVLVTIEPVAWFSGRRARTRRIDVRTFTKGVGYREVEWSTMVPKIRDHMRKHLPDVIEEVRTHREQVSADQAESERIAHEWRSVGFLGTASPCNTTHVDVRMSRDEFTKMIEFQRRLKGRAFAKGR